MAEPLRALEPTGDLVRRVLDAFLCGVYVHDLSLHVNSFVNAEYTRLTGYDMARLRSMDGSAFLALFHPEDRPRVAEHMAALRRVEDGGVLEIEYRFRRADGAWIWCLSRDAVFERGVDGSVRSIVGTFIDVSARRQAQIELNASETKARRNLEEIELIYDSAPIGLCVLDRDLRYVRINRRLAEINGIPVAAHIGRTVREVLPELADELEPLLRRVMETGEPALDREISGETPARPGVRRTWIESWLPLRRDSGEIMGISIVARETTEERRSLEALAESQQDYRLVADYTYDWEEWFGPDGELRWMSPSCHRITGYPPDAFFAEPQLLERITHPEDRPALREHFYSGFYEYEPKQLQFRIIRPDGEIRWVEHICQPVFGEGGGVCRSPGQHPGHYRAKARRGDLAPSRKGVLDAGREFARHRRALRPQATSSLRQCRGGAGDRPGAFPILGQDERGARHAAAGVPPLVGEPARSIQQWRASEPGIRLSLAARATLLQRARRARAGDRRVRGDRALHDARRDRAAQCRGAGTLSGQGGGELRRLHRHRQS
jgi:PAS domain S-box-containing protein